MNIFDEDDKRIEAILKEDIYEPNSFKQAIMTALSKKPKKKMLSFPRLIAAIIAGSMLISGIVYAKQIEEFILRFFNNSRGMDTAVENGYIEMTDVDFNTISNTKVKLKNFIMDDNNLSLTFKFNFESSFDKNNISSFILQDLIIYDELNNILYCDNKDTFDEFCITNDLKYEYLQFNNKYIDNTVDKNQNKNPNEIIYNIYSTTTYPKSKELNINFKYIKLIMSDGYENVIEGQWTAKVKVSDQFYNRVFQSYHVIETNTDNLIIKRFEIYNTGTIFEFETSNNPYITNDMTEKEKKLKEEEFLKWGQENMVNSIEKILIENSNGKKFYTIKSDLESKNVLYYNDGKLKYKNTFDLTKYDMTDTLTIYFTINTINEHEDVVIKLEKDN